ncbi:hypothetical protein ACFLYU_00735 [Candidatus Dependentiae bacterium]
MDRHVLKKFLFFFVFFVCFAKYTGGKFLQKEITKETMGVINSKASKHVVERKSLMLFNNLIYLMYKCDKYIGILRYRKTNANLYLLSKGQVATIFKARRDLIKEIGEKIAFFEKKKSGYAFFIGKLYKLAEPFIEGGFRGLSDQESNSLVDEFIKHIEIILPENYSDEYFNNEAKELKKLMVINKKREKIKKYVLLSIVAVISLAVLYRYRKSICNLFKNFFDNQIVKPLRNLRDWLFTSYEEDDLMNMTPEEILRDLEAQKKVVKEKVKDLVVNLDPRVVDPEIGKKSLDGIIEQAKLEGLEGFVAKCIRKAKTMPSKARIKKAKPGWIEWFLFGNKLNKIFGMPPKEKVLEIEIKGLLTRIAATKLLVEAKDGIDSNKLTLILGSFLPLTLASYSFYNLYSRVHNWYYEIPKKKKEINEIMFKLNDIINRNIGSDVISAEDQGFLCYLTNKFKWCLAVVPENVRSSIAKDLSYISSCANYIDKKLQILQSMKIMLYTG